MKIIRKVAVVGAGTMGSALAQKFAQQGFDVILADKEIRFVENGISRIKSTLNEGIERKLFKSEQVEKILSKIKGSDNLNDLINSDLIIEAIFEDLNAKSELFTDLSGIVRDDTIIATNTSSFSVNELSKSVIHPERFLGLHYFYHAAKNRLVEVIPGDKTSEGILKVVKTFCLVTGKDAIFCKDSYGFIVNRFFVPWLNEAARILEEKIASTSEIDSVCMKTFKIGMGPFALMNATGVPIAYHAQKTLESFGKFYKTSETLKNQAGLNKPWEIDENNSQLINDEVRNCIRDRMLGIVFLVCSQILDEKICNAVDVNRGARIGLRWSKGPIELMKNLGVGKVKSLIKAVTDKYNVSFPKSVSEVNWEMEFVKLEKIKNSAVITITRPEDMNALNEDIMHQLSQKFDLVNSDEKIKRIFITGEGKAFVAGADIKFFIDNIKSNTLNKIVSFTKFGQEVFEKIDKSSKTVISIVNGLALGGGFELALCSDIILAEPNAIFAFPETGIGIYPGLGGTQRTQNRIGEGLTKFLIYTGEFLNASDAERIGLVDGLFLPEDILQVMEGSVPMPEPKKKKIDEKYSSIQKFFENCSVSDIVNDKNKSEDPAFIKLAAKVKRKAPLALGTAEKLINEKKGCESELEELLKIFSTSDALMGLSTMGKNVEFQGK